MIGQIAQIALAVMAGLALIGFGIGYTSGKREPPRFGLMVVLTALLLGGFYFGTLRLAQQYGPVVTQEALLLASGGVIGLLGGYGIGSKQRKGERRGVMVHATVAAMAFVACFAALHIRNQELVKIADTLGLNTARERYEPEKNKDCPENLKSLYLALKSYAQDWDALPPATNWMQNEEVVSKVTRDEWLHCPAVSNRQDDRFGYALNANLAGKPLQGKPLAQQPDAATTPLLYDSQTLERSAQDAVTSLPKPGRHKGRNNILYLDGHVEAVEPK